MKLTNEQRKAKCAKERERYACMTPEQREAKRARQKLHDCRTQEQIEAKMNIEGCQI